MNKRIHTVDTVDASRDPFKEDPSVRAAITAVEGSWEQVAGERLRDGAARLLVEGALIAFTMAGGFEGPARRLLKGHARDLMDEAAEDGLRPKRRLRLLPSPRPGAFEAAPWFVRSADALAGAWKFMEGVTLGPNATHALTETALVAFALAGGLERATRDRLKGHAAVWNEVGAELGLTYISQPMPT